ncbi:MAG TPA: tail fiber domain-containing protein [Jiangellaceae bacterium]
MGESGPSSGRPRVVPLRKEPTGGSDASLKKDVSELDDGLEAVLALRPVTWRWKDERDGVDLQYGFIAQESKR